MTTLERLLYNAVVDIMTISRVDGCPDKNCFVCTRNAAVMKKVRKTIAIYDRRKENENGKTKIPE